jgi:hypothetical protein
MTLEGSVDFLADELDGWAALYATELDSSNPIVKERAHTYRVISRLLRGMVDASRPLPVDSDGS